MVPKPKVKKVRTPDPYLEGERVADVERRRLARARGRSSTILSGGGGDTSVPLIGVSRLAGGYGGVSG
jgi:hypothetical protein